VIIPAGRVRNSLAIFDESVNDENNDDQTFFTSYSSPDFGFKLLLRFSGACVELVCGDVYFKGLALVSQLTGESD
jgi:hypothetical protein